MAPLPSEYTRTNGLEGRQMIAAKYDMNVQVQETYNQPWNLDNLGPIVIPENKYFVLGDNRATASDSRTYGFIDKKEVITTLIYY